MISISTITADTSGMVAIDTDIPWENTARVSRTKTLDGGAYINNGGVCAGDMTVRVSAIVSEAQETTLRYIFQNYTSIHLATTHGFYLAVIETLKINNGDMNMTILIKSKESE